MICEDVPSRILNSNEVDDFLSSGRDLCVRVRILIFFHLEKWSYVFGNKEVMPNAEASHNKVG